MPVIRNATRIRRSAFKRDFARALRNSPTYAERRLWLLLRVLPVRFRRQQPVGPYIADVFCASAKLIIELDGDRHGTDMAMLRDAVRTRYLASRGYRVLRFPNYEIFQSPHLVLETILRAVHEANAPLRVRPLPENPSGIFDPPSRGG